MACVPAVAGNLIKKGFSVNVEENAGAASNFRNQDYEAVGANIVKKKKAFQSDIVLKLRQPSIEEASIFRDEGTLYSFLYPKQNKDLIDALAKRQLTAFGMDCVPRISRAQVFDALSSMGNISGYRAVVEASNHFGRFFTGKSILGGPYLQNIHFFLLFRSNHGCWKSAPRKSLGYRRRCCRFSSHWSSKEYGCNCKSFRCSTCSQRTS